MNPNWWWIRRIIWDSKQILKIDSTWYLYTAILVYALETHYYILQVDYREILKDLVVAAGDEIKGQSMVRPVCLLRVADDDKLYPVAIQLNWRQDLPNPIFYAVDQKDNPELWLYVKMWYVFDAIKLKCK